MFIIPYTWTKAEYENEKKAFAEGRIGVESMIWYEEMYMKKNGLKEA